MRLRKDGADGWGGSHFRIPNVVHPVSGTVVAGDHDEDIAVSFDSTFGLMLSASTSVGCQGKHRYRGTHSKSTGQCYRSSSYERGDDERLKVMPIPDLHIYGNEYYKDVSGIWEPESNDPKKRLVLKQQVSIECHRNTEGQNDGCVERNVNVSSEGRMISIMGPDETDLNIRDWNSKNLIASQDVSGTTTCHYEVLTMTFVTNSVSITDIPTGKAGCEAFDRPNSYKLSGGSYYVDTTPKNNMDKQ